VTLSGSNTDIQGSITVGAGGNTNQVISQGAASYGSSGTLPSNVTLNPVTIPSLPNASPYTPSIPGHTTTTLTPGYHYGNISTSAHADLALTAGTYVFDSLTLNGQSTLTTTGAVLVYINAGNLSLSGGTVVNNTGVSTNLVFMCSTPSPVTATSVSITGGASSAFAVYAPNADITIAGNADVYGAFIGKTVSDTGGAPIHYDSALANFTAGSFDCSTQTSTEEARSSPMVATIGGTVEYIQGTFVVYSPAATQTTYSSSSDETTFLFPYYTGHLRAFPTSIVSSTATAFNSLGSPDWDAAVGIPTVTASGCASYNGSCRHVFTNVAAGVRPTKIDFNTSNDTTLGPYLDTTGTMNKPTIDKLITKILQGRYDGSGNAVAAFGGIDRSTMAVIGTSPIIGTVRPTMVYVGGLDGMLHAICADTTSPCDAVGRELWAYIPRMQLSVLRLNNQRIDGSPKVTDLFGDFSGTGRRSWRTILAFQSASGDPTNTNNLPSVNVLDVTDPAAPVILWDKTTGSPQGTDDLGLGREIAMGPVSIGGVTKPAVFVETNNGGTGGAGIFVDAYSAEDWTQLWVSPFTYHYPNPPRVSSDAPVPATGIPAGVAAVSLSSTGATIDRLVVPDLYGDLWELDATTGTGVFGSSPLFSFSVDFQPIGASPTIYRDASGKPFALLLSGGYQDPAGDTWVRATDAHYAVSVKLAANAASVPYSETGSNSADRPFSINLGTDQRSFAQATVANNEVYIVTSTSDVNTTTSGTSQLVRFNVTNGQQIGSATALGASTAAAVTVNAGQVYVATTNSASKVDTSSDNTGTGTAAELTGQTKVTKSLWIRTQ
jgi:hypothetical protein